MRGWLLIAVLLLPPTTRAAAPADADWIGADPSGQPVVHLYFFWSATCPHCLAARPFVTAIPDARPWVRLHDLKLTGHPEHLRRYQAMAAALHAEAVSVPALAVCGEIQVGWRDEARTGALLLQRLDDCRARALTGDAMTEGAATARPVPMLELPVVGALDPAEFSLPVLTLVLAGLDAFNPCAFFVLLFLLSMLAHQKNRARMLIIGGAFVAVSGLMYFAFMAAWLNVFQVVGHLAGVTLAAGALAVLIGSVNVRDALRAGVPPTLAIPEARKPGLFRRMRAILDAERPAALLAATVVLAVAANAYELLCTAGFPMVYARVLTLADLAAAERYLWLAIYNLIYVIPLALIVGAFVWRLGARKLGEREGRLLKLLSGVMMLGLGILLLLAPAWLARLETALLLAVVAVGITGLAARRIAAR